MFFRTYADKLKSALTNEVKHHMSFKLGQENKNFKINLYIGKNKNVNLK